MRYSKVGWFGMAVICSVLTTLLVFTGFRELPAQQLRHTDAANSDGTHTEIHDKLHPSLEELYRAYTKNNIPGAASAWKRIQLENSGRKVRVIIEIRKGASILASRTTLRNFDARVESTYKNLIQAVVPIDKLPQIAEAMSGAFSIAPPLPRKAVKLDTSEGVSLMEADEYHNAGIKGEGVKIAIIDLGFDHLSEAISSGDLPDSAVVYTRDFSSDNNIEQGTNHGTEVAEIVHDMAPAAELYLMKFSTSLELGNAKEVAVNKGIHVINHSIGWFNSNFYDGTGTIANIAADARDKGIVWVNSAGNSAQSHWQGAWSNSDGDNWYNFAASTDEMNTVGNRQIGEGEVIYLLMTWNAWPDDAEDYDLYLFAQGPNGPVEVASSTNPQSGDSSETPTEALYYVTDSTDTYSFGIYNKNAPSTPDIELFSLEGNTFEYNVERSSITTPANDQKVVTVGAISQNDWTTGPQESFSSQGTTKDSQYASASVKPDVLGPDGVSTSGYGTFYGTSASSPHIAGAVALKKGQDGTRSADELESQITNDAVDMGTAGKDNIYGYGRVVLELTKQADKPDLVTDAIEFQPDTVQPGAPLNLSLSVKNQGNAEAPSGWHWTSYISRDQSLSSGDSLLSSGNWPDRIAAGASDTVSLADTIPHGLPEGTYHVLLELDDRDAVGESDETNNIGASAETMGVEDPPIRPLADKQLRTGRKDTVQIRVGSDRNPVTDLFGVSFELAYNCTYLEYVSDFSGSFLGSNVVYSSDTDTTDCIVGIGVTRKSGQGGVDGSGTVANVVFQADSGLTSEQTVQYELQQVSAIDPMEHSIRLDKDLDSTQVVPGLGIWPGDTNNDGVVDQQDVLSLALYWSTTGSNRRNSDCLPLDVKFVDSTPTWQPQDAAYADADGSGLVDQADVLCIGLNWGKKHPVSASAMIARGVAKNPGLGGNPISYKLSRKAENIYTLSFYTSDGSDVIGFSFELSYDPQSIRVRKIEHSYSREHYLEVSNIQRKKMKDGTRNGGEGL